MFLLLAVSTAGVQAQKGRDYSFSINKTDYRAFGVNPSLLSFSYFPDKQFTLGAAEYELFLHSEVLKKTLFHPKVYYVDDEGNTVTKDNLQMRDILGEVTRADAEVTYLGAAWRTKHAGSFGISLKSKWHVQTRFSDFANDALFDGDGFDDYIDTIVGIVVKNLAENGKVEDSDVLSLLDASELRLNVTHEINLGYSKKLWENDKMALYGGIAGRYIMGQVNMAIRFNRGNIQGILTEVPFVEEDLSAFNLPEGTEAGVKRWGHGFGTDIGATYVYDGKLNVGLSVVDMGFIHWPVYPIFVRDSLVQSVELSSTDDEEIQELFDQLVEEGLFTYGGKANNIEVLPAKIILNAGYRVHQRVLLYTDFIAPLNTSPKNIDRVEFGLGTRLKIVRPFSVTTGIHFRDYQNPSMPLYLNFFLGKKITYELGIGTADFISFFAPNRNTIPAQTAFARFHF